jgi:hypothetical protein
MYSHLERYIYTVNAEAVEFINNARLLSDAVPESLRLLHSRHPIDELQRTTWERRAASLGDFVESDAWLWQPGTSGELDPDRLLKWMKSPHPDNLERYYRYWGIPNIFAAIARKPQRRWEFVTNLRSLSELRNNIAHGDFDADATYSDVIRYVSYVRRFCTRADRVLGRTLGRLAQAPRPWT